VAGVAPGSPVDEAGVLPGDIVTALNGLPIGTDGTMKDYCDVIRTSAPGRPIEIEVLRYDTFEVLKGDLFSDEPIAAVFSFAEEVGQVEDPAAASAVYSGYQSLVDDTGAITVDVPNEWTSIDTAPFTLDDGTQLPYIGASTDLATFNASYDVPGMFFTVIAGSDGDLPGTIGIFAPAEGACTTDNGLADYSDAIFSGQYGYWSGCGGVAEYIVLAAVPADGSYTAILAFQIVSDADWEALDKAFNTFNTLAG
jgi:serine protease Do